MSLGFCYSSYLKDKHKCMEKAMHTNCPICFEFLFDTTKAIALLACGHNMHLGCIRQLQQRLMYACPVCSKSFCDMSVIWEKVDEIIESRPMPEEYQNVKIWILCNDCVETSEVSFHTMALKCPKCKSYNTRRTQAAPAEPAASAESAESAAPAESDASSSSSRVE
ncbi:E3 ubiquitin-protein ligase RZFP34 [Glycine soja]|uniref:E3 ubiquitin-protein ligase RZFP34 n=1 Tax=Glycine soja TaxID=3848 RepID=A0A445LDS4_GLYSO|nr:E3 ubiquitin-protein ligase RZFP34 [Glycine soja]